MRSVLSFLIALVACAANAQAQSADDVDRFTDKGRIMVNGSIDGYWSNDEAFNRRKAFSDWEFSAWPRVVYFVADHIGIGLGAGGGVFVDTWNSSRDRSRYAGAFLATVIELPLSERVSIIPMIDAGWVRRWTTTQPIPPDEVNLIERRHFYRPWKTDRHVLRASLDLPLAFHVSSSVAIGLGPQLVYERTIAAEDKKHVQTVQVPAGVAAAAPEETGRLVKDRVRIGASTWIGFSF